MNPVVEIQQNGRVRKTLASQLDRLDSILDGLADALNESVAAAVEKAVSHVLAEILTNPAFPACLRTAVNDPPGVERARTDAAFPPSQRGRGFLANGMVVLRAAWGYVRRVGRGVLRRAAAVADRALAYATRLLFRGRLRTYAAALVTLGVLAWFAAPRLPLLLTAVAGWLAALLARARTSMGPPPLACNADMP
jgi:hypothetical protein